MANTDIWVTVSNTFSTLGWVLLALSPFLLVIGIIVYRKKLGKFPIEAQILEKRGDNIIWTRDRIGRFYEAGIYKYKFKRSKDTLPIMNYDWMLHASYKPTNLFEKLSSMFTGTIGCVFIYKYGSKQYKPINIKQPDGKLKMEYHEIRGADGSPIMVQIYKQINPHEKIADVKFEVIDWDNINFMVQEHRAIDERRKKKQSFLQTYVVPLAMVGAAALIFIFAIYFASELVTKAMATQPGSGVKAEPTAKEGGGVPVIGDIIAPGK